MPSLEPVTAIRTVQNLLGHSVVRTMTIYTHLMATAELDVRVSLDG